MFHAYYPVYAAKLDWLVILPANIRLLKADCDLKILDQVRDPDHLEVLHTAEPMPKVFFGRSDYAIAEVRHKTGVIYRSPLYNP